MYGQTTQPGAHPHSYAMGNAEAPVAPGVSRALRVSATEGDYQHFAPVYPHAHTSSPFGAKAHNSRCAR